jgi:hypothetical protein
MLAACAAALVVGHLPYFYRDVVYSGPRFAFEALGPLSVLFGRVVVRTADWLESVPGFLGRTPRSTLIVGLAALLLAWPVAARLPEQVARHSDAYHGQTLSPLRDPGAPSRDADALVFLLAPEYAYGAWFSANGVPPTAARPLYVRDIPELRRRAMRTFGRVETWQLVIDFEAIEENAPLMRNEYADRFRIARSAWHRARPDAIAR